MDGWMASPDFRHTCAEQTARDIEGQEASVLQGPSGCRARHDRVSEQEQQPELQRRQLRPWMSVCSSATRLCELGAASRLAKRVGP